MERFQFAKKFFRYRICTRTSLELPVSNSPFAIPAKHCFLFGIFASVVMSVIRGPIPEEFLSVGNALFSAVAVAIGAVLVFWIALKYRKESVFPIFCMILGNIFGTAAVILYQGGDTLYVIVRLIGGYIVTCLVYQYFVKKIKTQTS